MDGQRRLILHGLALLLIGLWAGTAFQQTGEKVQVELRDQEIYVWEGAGQPRRLTHDGKPKEHLMLSPRGTRVIFHAPFDPYSSPRQPVTFTVLDVKTGALIQQISVRWVARYVSSVEWINDYVVMVRGEAGYLAILNLTTGKQTHNLVGSDFNLSPDRTMIVFHHDFNPRYGPIAQEFKSDYVLLSLVERAPASGQIKSEYDVSNFKVLYPDGLSWGKVEQRRHEDLDERHQIRSPLTWSPNSRMVAFVETHRQSLRLVVLKLKVVNNDVIATQTSFELGPATDKRFDLSWASGSDQISVNGEKAAWLIDLSTGLVQPLR